MVSYALGYVGAAALWVCFAAALAAIGCLLAGNLAPVDTAAVVGVKAKAKEKAARMQRLTGLGYLFVFVAAAAILVSCLVIVHGFFFHNVAIQYVAQNYP